MRAPGVAAALHTQLGGAQGCARLRRAQAAGVDATASGGSSVGSATSSSSSQQEVWGVILVAHGDVLQILQTAFEGVDPREHRSLPHLPNAELRWLNAPPSASAAGF